MYYNNERKERYLLDKAYSAATEKLYRTFFRKVSQLECLYNKDVVEFDLEQLQGLLFTLKCKTHQSIIAKVSLLRCYIYWEVQQGYLPSKNILIDMPKFKGDRLDAYLNETGKRAQYIKDPETLYQLVSQVYNPRDKAILCLLYAGVCGENYAELRYLKKQDCNFSTNVITIKDQESATLLREVKCTPQTMDIVGRAIETAYYIKRNGKSELKNSEVSLYPSEYVLRAASGSGPLSCKSINRFFRQLRSPEWDVAFYCQYLTPNTLRDSGLFHQVLCKENELAEQLEDHEFAPILAQYGLTESVIQSYRAKFQAFLSCFDFIRYRFERYAFGPYSG